MKYMDNIDRDHSMSLDHLEFAFNYAAMTHASAEAVFELIDENKDGKLTGKPFPMTSHELSRPQMTSNDPRSRQMTSANVK